MAGAKGNTSIGGSNAHFQSTEWTKILGGNSPKAILAEISMRYWKPLYCYLRRKGFSNEQAKDLVQGFFLEIIMGRELIQRADRTKGKFRTLLLTALDNYVISAYRHDKKQPIEGAMALDDDQLPATAPTEPIDAFNYAWASKVIDQVLEDLQTECLSDGKTVHWQVFQDKILNPILNNTKSPSYATLCENYDIKDEAAASNMIITVKRHFRRVLKRHIRKYVDSDEEVAEEIITLMEFLSRRGAGTS